MSTLLTTAALFCKPSAANHQQPLYSVTDSALSATITFRSLDLDTDIDILYDWVNRPYARRFWQLNGTKTLLRNTYHAVLNNPHAHAFIGLVDGQPVCQVDLYNVHADELRGHVACGLNDCGLHLLMMPPQQLQKGFSETMLRHFIRFYFSHSLAGQLFAEPDSENALANRLAKKTGFIFHDIIQLSYKTANLYSITKEQFHAANNQL